MIAFHPGAEAETDSRSIKKIFGRLRNVNFDFMLLLCVCVRESVCVCVCVVFEL